MLTEKLVDVIKLPIKFETNLLKLNMYFFYFTRILRNFANFSPNHQNLCVRLSYQFKISYRPSDYQNRVSEKYWCN